MEEFDKKGYCMSLDVRIHDLLDKNKEFKINGIFCDSSEIGFAWDETHYWINDNEELDKDGFHWYELRDLQDTLAEESWLAEDGYECFYEYEHGSPANSQYSSCPQDCSNCDLWRITEVVDNTIFKDLNIISINIPKINIEELKKERKVYDFKRE